MFTGIIEGIGTVKSIEKRGAFGRIKVATTLGLEGVKPGDSIAVDGACLTVTEVSNGVFTADLSDETLRVTTLGDLGAGTSVNLELALTFSKPLGGHLVTGHIDGVGAIRRKVKKGDSMDLEVALPEALRSQVVKKGSVAIDGVSLTVAEVTPDGVSIAVIPHTLKKTTLISKPEGAHVNIETDIIGKYVEKYFLSAKKGVTEGFLEEHGFFKKR